MSGKNPKLSIIPTYVIAIMYAGIANGISKSHEINFLNGKSKIEVSHAVTVPIIKVQKPTPKAKAKELKK